MIPFIFETKELPETISLIPVYGAVLMPRSQLPIPFTEAEYITLSTTALREHSYVGIVQPIINTQDAGEPIHLFKSGCLGKIADINETEDYKIMITLAGICRFDIEEELENKNLLRKAKVSYARYEHDLVEKVDIVFDRPRLMSALRGYFKHFGVRPDWEEIDLASNENLITTLTMICPLDASDKQAVLEAPSLKEQSQMLTSLIEFSVAEMNQSSSLARYH